MAPNKSQEIGAAAEEALRSYFWRAGFFAVRGVPVQVDGDDVTDLDIWLYERPTGAFRGIQFVDAKHKGKPKAFERVLWSAGAAQILGIDKAYVATTDDRPSLRKFAQRAGVGLIDGTDLRRIREAYSKSDWIKSYLSDDDLETSFKDLDKERKTKLLFDFFVQAKQSCGGKLSASSLVSSIYMFGASARLVMHEYEGTKAAQTATRLAYFNASLVAINLDFVLSEAYFRSAADRRDHLISAIRFGQSNPEEGWKPFRVAIALIEKYASNTNAVPKVRSGLTGDLQAVPAEIIADVATPAFKNDELFEIARSLNESAYLRQVPSFDELSASTKILFAALLDYHGLKRETFASRWSGASAISSHSPPLGVQVALPLNGEAAGETEKEIQQPDGD